MKNESNSDVMKTVVETFVIEETQELIYDKDKLDEWNIIVSELNLKGQGTLCSAENVSPIPFLHLKKSLVNVFETLCPVKKDISEYDITPIPVEILRLASLGIREKHFQKIQIWYDDVKPCPVCVGLTGYWAETRWGSARNKLLEGIEFPSKQEAITAGAADPEFNQNHMYLVGKWGDVKRPFEDLAEMAKERIMKERAARFKSNLIEAQQSLDRLETNVDLFLAGQYVNW